MDIKDKPATPWQRWSDRLARISFLILLVNVAAGIITGSIAAVTWDDPPWTPDSWRNVAFVLASFVYMIVIILNLPSLFIGILDHFRGRWSRRAVRWLAFIGSAAAGLGFEILSHAAFGCDVIPLICRNESPWGLTIYDQWHLLHHSLVAIIPLTLYWFALRKWHPSISPF